MIERDAFAGQVAIVTGGGQGIGKAIARALLQGGATVVIAARRMAVLERTAEELSAQHGGDVVPIAADTTDSESVDALAERAAALGRLAVLVNGAAAPAGLVRNDIADVDPEALLSDLNTKVVGYFRCVKAVAPFMRGNHYGRIVNIGGLTGRSSHALSGMRNLAVVHMTKALSDQLGPDGITINTIHPGVIETEHIHELYAKNAAAEGITPQQVELNFIAQTPIRRVIDPAEVANLVCFLASPAAGAITGESLGIDGGMTRGIFL
ncbi:MAG TPA: SDR family oxidoreductase [Kineosporiaceae bacterium]